MQSWWLRGAVVVLLVVNVFLVHSLLVQQSPSGTPVHAALDRSAARSPDPSSSRSRSSRSSPSRSSSAPSPTSSVTSKASTSASTSATPSPRIELARTTYHARAFRTLRVDGRVRKAGAFGSIGVRVEVRRDARWQAFPLPAVTDGAGRFHSYVDLGGPGRYRLRVVELTRRAAPANFRVVVG